MPVPGASPAPRSPSRRSVSRSPCQRGGQQRRTRTSSSSRTNRSPPTRAATQGIPATSPKVTGNKLKADSAPGLDYRSYLASPPEGGARTACRARPRTSCTRYRFAFAGLRRAADRASRPARSSSDPERRARLEGRAAAAAAGRRVTPTRGWAASTATAPSYLRLTDPSAGLWKQLGGPVSRNGAGAGVIVGVIDTGIQPGHPSFADRGNDVHRPDRTTRPPSGTAPARPATASRSRDCNNKLIGARYYVDGFGPERPRPEVAPLAARRRRPRHAHRLDRRGQLRRRPVDRRQRPRRRRHLGHLAALLRRGLQGLLGGQRRRRPAARAPTRSRRSTHAVADGVDVINYSVGSDTSTVIGAGRDRVPRRRPTPASSWPTRPATPGPGVGTVGSPASVPWLTTVAASHARRARSPRR